jgi:hypothetical protein
VYSRNSNSADRQTYFFCDHNKLKQIEFPSKQKDYYIYTKMTSTDFTTMPSTNAPRGHCLDGVFYPYPTIRAPLVPTSVENVLLNETPFNMDIINMIMDFNAPRKFEVGKKYYTLRPIHNVWEDRGKVQTIPFTVIKRTKCFITVQEDNQPKPRKPRKIYTDSYNGDEYISFGKGWSCNILDSKDAYTTYFKR